MVYDLLVGKNDNSSFMTFKSFNNLILKSSSNSALFAGIIVVLAITQHSAVPVGI